MGSVRQLTDFWYCDFIDERGIRHRVKGGKTRQDAEVELRLRLVEVDRIRAGLEERSTMDVRLEHLRDRYLEDMKLRRRPATVSIHAYALKLILPFIDATTAKDLSLRSLKRVTEILQKRGCAGRTINIYLGALRRCLSWAEENGHIPRNPIPKIPKLREIKQRVRRALREEEAGKIRPGSKRASFE